MNVPTCSFGSKTITVQGGTLKCGTLEMNSETKIIFTENGMESIRKANESATLITVSNEELEKQIHLIDAVAGKIKNSSDV